MLNCFDLFWNMFLEVAFLMVSETVLVSFAFGLVLKLFLSLLICFGLWVWKMRLHLSLIFCLSST